MERVRKQLFEVIGQIARTALWAPLTVIALHEVAGGLFGHEPYVDPIVHFLGGLAAAFFFWQAAHVAGRYLGELNPFALGLIAFGLAVAAAVAWEVGEFASDVFLGTNIQRDVSNTMRDLILGTFGAGLFVVLRWSVAARR